MKRCTILYIHLSTLPYTGNLLLLGNQQLTISTHTYLLAYDDGDIPRPAPRVGDYTKGTSQANLPKLNLNNTLYIFI